MRKNKFLILFILSLGAGCSNSNQPETLISLWDKDYPGEIGVERKLAALTPGKCLKDNFDVSTLKQKMLEYESKYKGKKVTGHWKHIDLSKLPIPQAKFLKTYGSKIGDLANPQSIDYSKCEDVPCIFNKIYGKEDYVAGYVHYIWYLKFGHMLSADNLSPDQNSKIPGEFNGKKFALKDYLYNEQELYGFWRLSLLHGSPLEKLTDMTEIQRLPRGERFEEADYLTACGLASGDGNIRIIDPCLTMDSNIDKGFFYTAIFHEMTHQLDFQEGKKYRATFRSEQPDYVKYTGLYLHEYKDKGNLKSEWKQKDGIKIVRSYAGTNPVENFADTIAYFRLENDFTKSNVTGEQFNFISQNYFDYRIYDQEALIKHWLLKNSSSVYKSIFKAFTACSEGKGSYKWSSFFREDDFKHKKIIPSMVNCMSLSAEEIAQDLESLVTSTEPEACTIRDDYLVKSKWKNALKEHLLYAFRRFLDGLQYDKDYLEKYQIIHNELGNNKTAQDAYVNCYGEKDEFGCFTQKVVKRIKSRGKGLGLNGDLIQDLVDAYLNQYPYNKIEQQTSEAYNTLMSTHFDEVNTSADEIWEACSKRKQNDEIPPRGGLFQINDGYMKSSRFNCINDLIPEAAKKIVQHITVDGYKVQNPKEELIINNGVKTSFFKLKSSFSGIRL